MTKCTVCMAKFGLFNKEDSCRRCGHFVCSKCSSAKVSLEDHAKPVRVCNPCIDILKEQEQRRQQQQQQEQQQQQQQARHAQVGGPVPGQHIQPNPGTPAPDGPPPHYSDIEHLPRWYRRQVFPNVAEEEVRVAKYPEPQPEATEADERGLPRWLAAQKARAQQPQAVSPTSGAAQQQHHQRPPGRLQAERAGGGKPKAATSQPHGQQRGSAIAGDSEDIAAVLHGLSVPTHEPALPDDASAHKGEGRGNNSDTQPNSSAAADKDLAGDTPSRDHGASLSDLHARHERVFGKRDTANAAGVSPSQLAAKYKSIFGADPTKRVPRKELLARFKKVTGRHIDEGASRMRARQWPTSVDAMSDDDLADMLVQEARDQISLEGGDATDDDGGGDEVEDSQGEEKAGEEDWDDGDGPVDEEEKRRINALTKQLITQAEQNAVDQSASTTGAPSGSNANTNVPGPSGERGADDLSGVLADLQREHDRALRDLSQENIQTLLHDSKAAIQAAQQEEEAEAEGSGESERGADDGAVPPITRKGEERGKKATPQHSDAQEALYQELRQHPLIWPFLQPLDAEAVPEFFEAVQDPLDMREVRRRMDGGAYGDRRQLHADLHKMLEDAVRFHGASSVFGRYALALQAHLDAMKE